MEFIKLDKWIEKIFRRIFASEFLKLKQIILTAEIHEKRIKNLLKNIDVSVDVHQYASSWAVISIQGERTDYIKFINLGKRDLIEIRRFLKHYDRTKIDAHPAHSEYLKII